MDFSKVRDKILPQDIVTIDHVHEFKSYIAGRVEPIVGIHMSPAMFAFVDEHNYLNAMNQLLPKQNSVFEHVPAQHFAIEVGNAVPGPSGYSSLVITFPKDSVLDKSFPFEYVSKFICEVWFLNEACKDLAKLTKRYKISTLSKNKIPRTVEFDSLNYTPLTASDIPTGKILFSSGDEIRRLFKFIAGKTLANGAYLYSKMSNPSYNSLARVIDVITVGADTRLCILETEMESAYSVVGYVSIPGDPVYNYMDRGRHLILDKKSNTNISFTGVLELRDDSNNIIFDNSLEMDRLVNDCKKSPTLSFIDQKLLESYLDPKQVAKLKQQTIKNKAISKIVNSTLPHTINGLLVDKNKFSFGGIEFKALDAEAAEIIQNVWQTKLHILKYRSSSVDYKELINFNSMYEQFFSSLGAKIYNWKFYRRNMSIEFLCAGIKVKVEKRVLNSSSYLINGIKLTHKELVECAEKVLCYSTQEDFDAFLKIVSKCNLELHRVLDKGVKMRLRVTNNVEYICKLNFAREKGKNFLITKTGKVRVNHLPRLAGYLAGITMLSTLCNYFGNKKYFPNADFDEEAAAEFISWSKEIYDTESKREQELLQKAVEVTKAEIISDEEISGIHFSKAYRVTGLSGNKYIVSPATNNGGVSTCNVYVENKDGLQYICVVDRKLGDESGSDKIINRMYALKNDTQIVEQVDSLAELI